MAGSDIKITSSSGGQFDAYLAAPDTGAGPGVVIVPAVHGVIGNIRNYADDLAANGCLVAAIDPFWRTDPGPTGPDDPPSRASSRAKPRIKLIEQGVADVADALANLKARPECNGRTATMGFCYGGPYAVLGATRLGCDAGISYHGTKVETYFDELELNSGSATISLHWGDLDHAAPPHCQQGAAELNEKMANLDVIIYPGVLHGYMMKDHATAYNQEAYDTSFARTLEILTGLQDAPQRGAA
ncbi:MAG: dienelactone hydrolase family protein [Rhodospirillales bacterium]|nr:dienelactone hydrolase family protein [Rhodospirillales bacterium]